MDLIDKFLVFVTFSWLCSPDDRSHDELATSDFVSLKTNLLKESGWGIMKFNVIFGQSLAKSPPGPNLHKGCCL